MATEWEKAQQESVYAKQMLARADQYMAAVDNAFIIRERGHNVREMPLFGAEEISLGKVLGTGGFGIVNEIKGFFLDPEEEELPSSTGTSAEASATIENEKPNSLNVEQLQDANGASSGLRKRNNGSDPKLNQQKPAVAPSARIKQYSDGSDVSSHDTHIHYQVKHAKQLMSQRAAKNGVVRYAIKRLHNDLTELEKARGMIDLAVEAKYLSTVWHPNIIKMRGMAKGNMVDNSFFIILDRLDITLDRRMNQWYTTNKKSQGFCGIGKKKIVLHRLLVERMTVAYDLAAAFFYLHENRLVYRDIKPENIGFDVRGDVKIFDFGLCKSLSPHLKAKGYGYRLTGRAGSLPYMAPEVARMDTYDTKCDVFSFAILLWEILSLLPAFKGLVPSEFVEHVVVRHERPVVPLRNPYWPPLTRLMLPEAWDNDPAKRPDMKRVAILIRGDLNDMTDDIMILKRTKHMRNRSDHSFEFPPLSPPEMIK